MKYTLKINIYTDGDFSLPFVPRDMKWNESYTYKMKKHYNNREAAINDALDVCSFLKAHMHTSKDYIKDHWENCIDTFVERLKSSKESLDEYIDEYMPGNYEATEFIFSASQTKLRCEFEVTDEEWDVIRSNKHGIQNHDVIETIIKLYRDGKKEDKYDR